MSVKSFFTYLGRAPASQGRHLTGFASLGASHASPLQAAHAKPTYTSINVGAGHLPTGGVRPYT
jgi:hypothetical protein